MILYAGGRVVFVNAELHTLATEASPDFVYSGSSDVQPYARQVLSMLWRPASHPALMI